MLSSVAPQTNYSLSNDGRPFELPASSWIRKNFSIQAQLRSARENKVPDHSTSPNPPLTQPTRWDEYSGEPTRNGAGRPSQVHPSTFDETLLNGRSYNVTISGGPDKHRKPSWSERAVKIGKDALSLDMRATRRSGSSKTARADSANDSRSNSYTAVKSLQTDSESDNSLGTTSNKIEPYLGPIDPDSVSPMMPSELMREYGNDDVSPIIADPEASSRFEAYAANSGANVQRVSSGGSIIRKPVGSSSHHNKENKVPAQVNSHFSWATTTNSDADSVNTSRTSRTVGPDQMQNSQSRFSWTTINTATDQQGSPPASPPPFPPPLDSRAWKTRHQAQHLQDETPNPTERKHMSGEKSLPQPPTISKTMNHVDALVAQRDDLSLQRRNIEKIMSQLQQIDKASPLEVDWSMKKANLKRLEDFKVCLEEVEREEHEVGRSLARARRKAEREEGVDSGLWVRRVTG
ncbi:hypothetical protein MBLNU457_6021t1 [Dothideomycetes sp. NU457]